MEKSRSPRISQIPPPMPTYQLHEPWASGPCAESVSSPGRVCVVACHLPRPTSQARIQKRACVSLCFVVFQPFLILDLFAVFWFSRVGAGENEESEDAQKKQKERGGSRQTDRKTDKQATEAKAWHAKSATKSHTIQARTWYNHAKYCRQSFLPKQTHDMQMTLLGTPVRPHAIQTRMIMLSLADNPCTVAPHHRN